MLTLRTYISPAVRPLLGLIAAAIVAISTPLLSGCEGRIAVSGRVVDDSTKAPIAGAIANLSLTGRDYPSDTTGSDGWHEVSTFLVGMVWGPPTVTLKVRKDGYKPFERELGERERGVTVSLKRE